VTKTYRRCELYIKSVLQCVAVCYSVLQRVASSGCVSNARRVLHKSALQRVAVCCSELQRVAVCCSS